MHKHSYISAAAAADDDGDCDDGDRDDGDDDDGDDDDDAVCFTHQ